jgi:flagellar basal body-associated protein FliL
MFKTYDRAANRQTGKGNGDVTIFLLMILIVLLILGMMALAERSTSRMGWRPMFTPSSPMLGYGLDDAEPAISIA